MSRYASHVSSRQTPQTNPILGRQDQVKNNAGGFVFAVDDWTRLERFLVLGNELGTYYATEQTLTRENAEVVARCLAADAVRTIATIIAISDEGRAPKNAPCVFALAMACERHIIEVAALDGLNKVCRIPTDLFAFCDSVAKFRGWGSALRRLVANWYNSRTPEKLAYQVTKYRQRDGWTHRDVLRLCHASSYQHRGIFRHLIDPDAIESERTITRRRKESSTHTHVYGVVGKDQLPPIVIDFEGLQAAPDSATAAKLIRQSGKLAREHVPTQFLNDPAVWDALLPTMPLKALIRSLGKLSAVGLLVPLSDAARLVVSRLGDPEYIRKSRIHPMDILLAARVYGAGHGIKGKLHWTPVSPVVDALDSAFNAAFANVVPTGKRRLLAIDVSGSMTSPAAGSFLSCREAAAAMALIVARTEANYQMVAFTSTNYGGFHPSNNALTVLPIGKSTSLAETVRITSNLPFGGTDCSLPMMVAIQEKWQVDSFEIYTDSETWAGNIHPCQALRLYREKSGVPAKLVVQAFAANKFSIADPNDGGMMDVVGLDAAAPAVVADFIRG